ncbi:MAG: DUF565 domain-containing protein [Xenococcaceae cyanobacterium]
MQRTRLNLIIDVFSRRLELLFTNPWRRIALILISFLLGFFMGNAIVTTAGQDAAWDVIGTTLIFTYTELLSRFIYRRNSQPRGNYRLRTNLILDSLNLFKMGVIYSLFLEAFKLGS